jgi:hypothetical protein
MKGKISATRWTDFLTGIVALQVGSCQGRDTTLSYQLLYDIVLTLFVSLIAFICILF